MLELILAIMLVTIVVMIILKEKCILTCGSNVEKMTAGLGTINSMSMYNHGSNCHKANAMGSNSDFCTSSGYVLI